MRDGRGQAYALEGIIAALLLVGSLVFALQVTAVTPLSASTSSQHIENQQRAVAEGVFATAVEQDALKIAVLNWNHDPASDPERFYGIPAAAERSFYADGAPDNEFGDLLERAFGERGIVFNVYVRPSVDVDDDGDADGYANEAQRMVYRGEPSDNAVTATRLVTLYDDDVLYDDDEHPTSTRINENDFYAEDVTGSSDVLYNVVRVEVVVWRQ